MVKLEVPLELKTEKKKSVEKRNEKEEMKEIDKLWAKAQQLFEQGNKGCSKFMNLK